MNEGQMPLSVGELIREKLKDRGWNQTDLAKILGRPVPAISEIISGKRGLTAETAAQLAIAFENDAREWLALDNEQRLTQVDASDVEVIARRTRLFSMAPIKEMERRGWINETATAEELEQELCRFFQCDSLDSEPVIEVSRRSSVDGPLNPQQRAWCVMARRLAQAVEVSPWRDGAEFDNGVKKLRQLAAWPENACKVPAVLAKMGIRFVVIEPLMKTRIDGAAFWLDSESPVIALSVRFDRVDSFWHTLGHELSHIRHRDGEALDVDLVGENRLSPAEQDTIELRADQEAAATWVDPAELNSFILRVGPLYERARINQFANKLRIHPGIIVGQLQYRGELGYQKCRDALVKIRDSVTSQALTDGWGHMIKP